MNKKLIYNILLLISIIFSSCTQKESYYHFHELKDSKWNKYDTLYFDIDSTCITLNTPYNLEITLINNTDYPYQNIWLYIDDNFKNKNIFERQEKEYSLCNETGKWYGTGFGSLYQLNLSYKKNFSFLEKRNYQVKMVQGMRSEYLIGIEKVGVKLIPSQ